MSKKAIIVLVVLVLILVVSTIALGLTQVGRGNPVKHGLSGDGPLMNNNSNHLISALWKLVPTIKQDISKNIIGLKNGSVFSNDYRISDDPYLGGTVNIIKYDKRNPLLNEPSGDGETVRDLKKEKQFHLAMKAGEHQGNIYVLNEGYQDYPYSVRSIGQNKYLITYCFFPSGGTYVVNYTTFKDKYLREISFYMQDEEVKRAPGVGGNIALVIGFKKERQNAIRKMDALVKAIF